MADLAERIDPQEDTTEVEQELTRRIDRSNRTGRSALFLNRCVQSELDSLFQLVSIRSYKWNRFESDRDRIECLYGLKVRDQSGTIIHSTHTGSWWMDWCECCLFFPGRIPQPLTPPMYAYDFILQLRVCPNKFGKPLFEDWLGSQHSVKMMASHVAFPHSNRGTPLPVDLGSGSSISHLCDTKGCVRRVHLELATRHQLNMERQRCQGVTLAIFDGVIVKETPCPHESISHNPGFNPDFMKSCRRLRLIMLDDLASFFGWLGEGQKTTKIIRMIPETRDRMPVEP